MAGRMGYKATLDWLIDNEDLSGFARNDDCSSPRIFSVSDTDFFSRRVLCTGPLSGRLHPSVADPIDSLQRTK